MALKLTKRERRRLYYLEHQQEIKKKCKEYLLSRKKVKPKRQRKLPPQQGPFSALFIGVEND